MGKRQKKLVYILEEAGLMDKEIKFGCVYTNGLGTHKYTGIHPRDKESKEIIGQYHLGSILQLFKRLGALQIGLYGTMARFATGGSYINFSIKSPPMEREEEQNKELVLFIEEAHGKII